MVVKRMKKQAPPKVVFLLPDLDLCQIAKSLTDNTITPDKSPRV
jgi:hypothetical protein